MTKETISKMNDEILERIKAICTELYPNLDSIQIFITKHESNEYGTTSLNWGLGNFYARYGQITQWLKTQDNFIEEDEN